MKWKDTFKPDPNSYRQFLAPVGVDYSAVDLMIEDLKSGARSNPNGRERLFTSAGLSFPHLKPDRRQLLNQMRIIVLPDRRCHSFTQLDETGEGEIVISDGMVDLIAASLHCKSVLASVPNELKEVPIGTGSRQLPLLLMLGKVFDLLRYRFYRFGERMPDFSRLTPPEFLLPVEASLSGALLFMLLHELAHIQLKHLTTNSPRLTHYELVYAQNLSNYQLQEIEADEYALNSVDNDEGLCSYWMTMSLLFFVDMERISGLVDSTHPLAINRANAAALKRSEWEALDTLTNDWAAEFQRAMYSNGRRAPSIVDIARQEIETHTRELVKVFKAHGLDYSVLLDCFD